MAVLSRQITSSEQPPAQYGCRVQMGAGSVEQPLPQCQSTNSVSRAFFLRVAIGCRLSLKIDRNLPPFWAGGGLISGYMILYDVNRRYGIWRILIQICGADIVLLLKPKFSSHIPKHSRYLMRKYCDVYIGPFKVIQYQRS